MDEHRDDERIVEAIRLPTLFEADAAAKLLERAGITAMVAAGDAGGWMPHFSVFQGHRVLVFESDLDEAREILADNDVR
jgi:hypothetical protein